jgi:hypothetical protein
MDPPPSCLKNQYNESISCKYLISSMLEPAVLQNKIANTISDTIHMFLYKISLS